MKQLKKIFRLLLPFSPSRTVLRHRASSSASSDDETPVQRHPARKPRLGTWSHSSNKPFALIKGVGKHRRLIMFNVKNERGLGQSSGARQQPNQQENQEIYFDSSPMISNSGNVMMSAMYQYDGQAVGPLEAFYPFTSVNCGWHNCAR